MKKEELLLYLVAFYCMVLCVSRLSAMTANPLLSRGKTVYTSSGTASYLTDNKFAGSTWAVGANKWLAINIGAGPSKVFFSWNCPQYTWSDSLAIRISCKSSPAVVSVTNYTLQKSANSTNGSDGDWTTMATVTNNRVTARGHIVDFTGAGWIKMNITSGSNTLDEIEVFNLSNNGDDSWFFPGTSITANTYKSTPPTQNFADLVNASHSGYNPVMIRGGIPCIMSRDIVTDISKYLAIAGTVKHWAIEMGTNDAWGGGTANLTSFKNSLQLIVDSCKAVGIQPMIARILATHVASGAATWQVNPAFLAEVDSLTKKNNLVPGPDLYSWFLAHPGELNSDGVHPNATGAASIQRLWAQSVDSLYRTAAALRKPETKRSALLITNDFTQGLRIVDVSGRLTSTGKKSRAFYIVKFTNTPAFMNINGSH
jgi:lysophospholipase L1-like esterase